VCQNKVFRQGVVVLEHIEMFPLMQYIATSRSRMILQRSEESEVRTLIECQGSLAHFLLLMLRKQVSLHVPSQLLYARRTRRVGPCILKRVTHAPDGCGSLAIFQTVP